MIASSKLKFQGASRPRYLFKEGSLPSGRTEKAACAQTITDDPDTYSFFRLHIKYRLHWKKAPVDTFIK